MKDFRYIGGVATLELDTGRCVGCGMCETVCPHRIFTVREKQAVIRDIDACMECGACARNCPTKAIAVTPGVGCAAYIISTWIHRIKGSAGTRCC
ncbi:MULTISPECIES: mercury methylation ferredoxin HgcB [Desulfococcus]|jgi:ferredoxin|uniref:4Fe-4S ferredoxin, iron-sulpur binding domain-containing protein n=1 Tax=Desulfococcus multivorans DSM 2059 TaxID=1121405 RepID=S7TZF6_DESML|nr:mercury methylation ferredoxin HgcB [Desulfococcus multivorans]AOY58359.1 4Fe-4S ferredoxin iron-sulfur binding domain protein [Desulfococcus multivorans]AQV00691.1 ferredoxin [Desulfococcus multivorans]EPR42566.1 4Fe-4S ferredoxin, iron-sulpur binding domain-containing protein [Desulfococcus multivorans DSM 2059]MDX9818361.1 mercury methylation ferredoxin HgcB [Desulfococcus multivorans]SKA18527.1 4Fe-4S dicluster domain-containing protein [Desulfococcus multivorans DSM 2059]